MRRLVLTLLTLLTACTSDAEVRPLPPIVETKQVYVFPDEASLICKRAPGRPASLNDLEFSDWLTDLAFAGEDCRGKLDALRQWIKEKKNEIKNSQNPPAANH